MSSTPPSPASEHFTRLISEVTGRIQKRPLDEHLQAELNALYPPDSPHYRAIFSACRSAIESGWMCNRASEGIRYGRVIRPGKDTHEFSVDVVDMSPLAGPHHRHPNGEIDLIMPLEPGAQFDGHEAGWLVYGPDSAHRPTVTGGRALILYLLPAGAIEFSRE